MKAFDREALTQDLTEILSKLAYTKGRPVTGKARLREDLGLDSLSSMELLSRISEKWEVEVEMEDLMDVETVGGVIDYFERRSREATT